MERKINYLPANRETAIRLLKLKYFDRTLNRPIDETPFFLLYLNYAVNNIVAVTGIDPQITSPETLDRVVSDEAKVKLVNFLWLFKVDNPKDEFPSPECLARAVALAKKIFELRNFFTHLNENGSDALVLNRDLYVLIEGELGSLARTTLMETAGIRSDKVNKLKLAVPHNDEKTSYELTRKGLIFLTCLALYKDDAAEFCSLFHDMKLPTKQLSVAEKAAAELPGVRKEENELSVNISKAKALHEMFTMFSMRKGRDLDILAEDFNFMAFTDIIGYLNKVPAVSHDYLSLDKETSKLQALADASTESEENKRFKYKLHRRFRDRFLSFAAGYCEDFDLLPSVYFKRLDITPVSDRKRYLFGKEQDNRLRMDRHYAIVRDAIRFEWRPQKHHGPIHIGALRSSISSSQMKNLLALFFRKGNASVLNDEVDGYFSAYHTVLEKMVNIADCNDLYLDSDPELLRALSVVTGKSETDILADDADILAITDAFFPANLMRFFLDTDNRMSVREMQVALYNKLAANIDRAEDFLARLNTLDAWRKAPHDPEHPSPMPVCSKDDVKNPPRHCKFSDADLCAWVFHYINLFLEDGRKFRQLPKSKQHRGDLDYEYQFIQSLVGKFNLDQSGLWKVLEKRRPELKSQIDLLKSGISRQLKDATRATSSKFPRGRRPQPTLTMLARAAAERYSEFCSAELKKYEEEDASASPDLLRRECRRFGIRPGMEKDKDALIRTVLRLDPGKWSNAFDYEKNAKRSSARPLDSVEHIVSQIPFPNLLMQRFAASVFKKDRAFLESDGSFDFNKSLRTLENKVALRDYYDVAPLISYAHTHDRTNPKLADDAPGIRKDCATAVFSAAAISRAVAAIKDVRNQDALLCRIAFDYWDRFKAGNTTVKLNEKKTSIQFKDEFTPEQKKLSVYEVFSAPVLLESRDTGGKKIQLVCNDVNRPILAQIKKYFKTIVKHMDADAAQEVFDFYRLVEKMREISASDRSKRLEMINLVMRFDAIAPIPAEKYASLNRDKARIRAMEIAEYARKFPGFSAQEYETLANARNAVFHDGLDLDVDAAIAILQKYLP